ncbi:hypothetical protein [Helicobacter bizzozeronii]|uniref:hypothetical protein n=1 Tax=Helicobacter bizzozeronii TaxID=56877 RepID=UPI000CF0280F|nr:hypothetical protein [Helicobacter bizzozeronii]
MDNMQFCSIENALKRMERVERFGLFILFVGMLQACVLGFMLVESFVLLQNANASVNHLEIVEQQLAVLEKKIDLSLVKVKQHAR